MAGMNKIIRFFILISILFTAGCLKEDTPSASQPIIKYEDRHITYLFSNIEQMEEESSYYDALLDFRRSYPDYINTINIVTSNDQELVDYFSIDIYPTLVVIYDSNVMVRIEGFKDSREIYGLLKASLSSAEDAF